MLTTAAIIEISFTQPGISPLPNAISLDFTTRDASHMEMRVFGEYSILYFFIPLSRHALVAF